MQLKNIKPNAAHMALAELEKRARSFTLITQNVDDLHERAGSVNIIHMHGELRKVIDLENSTSFYYEDEILKDNFKVWRPDIVWFGEAIKGSSEISNAIKHVDLFLCVGTSHTVYPAAGLMHQVNGQARTVEFNLGPTSLSDSYDENIYGPCSKTLPEYVLNLLK